MPLRSARVQNWPAWLLAGFAVLASAYLAAGLSRLVWDIGESRPIDLRLRWIESQLLIDGINPQTAGHPDPGLDEGHAVMRTLGGSYPPWAYATGVLLAPPFSWEATRWYALLLNLVALGVIAWWVHRQLRRFGDTWTWIAVAAALAVFPISICVSYGQYSVIVVASLAAVDLLLLEPTTGREIFAGLLLGFACVKPQLAGLFGLALLLERQWVTVAACAGYVAVASGITWWLAGSDPLTMMRTSASEAAAFSFLSHNILSSWARATLPFQAATAVLAIGGTAITAWLLWSFRHHPRLVRWSVCAVVAMFWAYRKHYDVPLLVFPMTALLMTALARRTVPRWLVYGLFGLTMWLPIRDAQWDAWAVQAADLALWGAGLGLLLTWEAGQRAAAGREAAA